MLQLEAVIYIHKDHSGQLTSRNINNFTKMIIPWCITMRKWLNASLSWTLVKYEPLPCDDCAGFERCLHLPVNVYVSTTGSERLHKEEASDEDEDTEYFDAMEDSPAFITVTATDNTQHRSVRRTVGSFFLCGKAAGRLAHRHMSRFRVSCFMWLRLDVGRASGDGSWCDSLTRTQSSVWQTEILPLSPLLQQW